MVHLLLSSLWYSSSDIHDEQLSTVFGCVTLDNGSNINMLDGLYVASCLRHKHFQGCATQFALKMSVYWCFYFNVKTVSVNENVNNVTIKCTLAKHPNGIVAVLLREF